LNKFSNLICPFVQDLTERIEKTIKKGEKVHYILLTTLIFMLTFYPGI